MKKKNKQKKIAGKRSSLSSDRKGRCALPIVDGWHCVNFPTPVHLRNILSWRKLPENFLSCPAAVYVAKHIIQQSGCMQRAHVGPLPDNSQQAIFAVAFILAPDVFDVDVGESISLSTSAEVWQAVCDPLPLKWCRRPLKLSQVISCYHLAAFLINCLAGKAKQNEKNSV